MSEEDDTNAIYGTLIRVKEINKLKNFQRDVIGLGDPVVDSNFWVEFKLAGNGLLVLEQGTNMSSSSKTSHLSCLIYVSDFELTMKTLKSRELKPELPAQEIPGRVTATVMDPEGNLITIYSYQ